MDLQPPKKFNPLDAENWYSVSRAEILSAGGAGMLRNYYRGSHIKALVRLYPELVLKKKKSLRSREGWKSPENGRKFFDGFAASKKFNPLDAKNWYSITYNEIIRAGGRGLLYYYKGSFFRALMELYPELKSKEKIFLVSKSPKNQRRSNNFILKSGILSLKMK